MFLIISHFSSIHFNTIYEKNYEHSIYQFKKFIILQRAVLLSRDLYLTTSFIVVTLPDARRWIGNNKYKIE